VTAIALCDTIVRQVTVGPFQIPRLTRYYGVNDNIAPS